jgi:hypothetical protein
MDALVGEDFRTCEVFNYGAFPTDSVNAVDVGTRSPPATLFQSGHLTVDVVENVSGERRYRPRYPNLEVEASIWRFHRGLRDALTVLPELRKRASAVVTSLDRLEAAGFQKAFETALGSIPPNQRSPDEDYHHTVLMDCLGLAGQRYGSEGQSGGGSYDLNIRTIDGPWLVIELKYESSINTKTKEDLTPAQLETDVGRAAREAMARIDKRKYQSRFQGEGDKIFKMALVIGGRDDVLAVFEPAGNWSLVKDIDGRLMVAAG